MMDPISVRFPPPMRQEMEQLQAERMDRPHISAIVRMLCAEALEARRKVKARAR